MPLTSHTKDRMPHIGHVSRAVRNTTCIGVLASILSRQSPFVMEYTSWRSPDSGEVAPLAAEVNA